MPGRPRGETRTRRDISQEEIYRMGLIVRMSQGAYTSHLASQESINEALLNTACHLDHIISLQRTLVSCPRLRLSEKRVSQITRNLVEL